MRPKGHGRGRTHLVLRRRSIALAGALAFGVGGRDLAAQMLGQAYDAGQRNAGQVRQDVQTGRDRAEAQTQRAKREINGDGVPPDAVRPA